MMTDRELMQQAVEKLEFFAHMKGVSEDTRRLITALRERLAQPERESVKFNCTVVDDAHPEGVPLSQWGRQPLSEEEITNIFADVLQVGTFFDVARAIEQAHGVGGQDGT